MGFRSLGVAGSPLQVSGPFMFTAPSLICSAPSAELQPQFRPWAGSCHCGRGSAGEAGNRACASFPGLLQPSLCDSQGHRWVVPGDRPLPPQQLGGCLPFPHGDYPVCFLISPSRRLDGIPGSLGCVPPGSGPSVFATLPEVLRGRVGLPVPHPLLRPVDDSAGVYSRHDPGLFDNASSRFPDSLVPDDWLVLGSSFQEIVQTRDFLLWLCQQLGIQINTLKSSLTPTQLLDYLGMTIQTVPLRVFSTSSAFRSCRLFYSLSCQTTSIICLCGASFWESCPPCQRWFPVRGCACGLSNFG